MYLTGLGHQGARTDGYGVGVFGARQDRKRGDTVVETHTKRQHVKFELELLLRTLPQVRDLP